MTDRLCIYGYDSLSHKYKAYKQASSGWDNMLPENVPYFRLNADAGRSWIYFNHAILAVGAFGNRQRIGNQVFFDGVNWKVSTDTFSADSIFFVNSKVYGFSGRQSGLNYIGRINFAFGRLSGYMYRDKNSNCQRDPTDDPVSNQIIRIDPGPVYAVTGPDGFYDISLPADSYAISPFIPKWYQSAACSANKFGLRFLTNEDTAVNFILTPASDQPDISVKVIGSSSGMRARQGYTEEYTIICTNKGTVKSMNTNVTLDFPSSINLISSDPGLSVLGASQLGWELGSLEPNESFRISLKFKIPLKVALKSRLTFTVNVTDDNDADLVNNNDSLVQIVTAGIDPNDKQCSVDSIFTRSTTKLAYQIRFQNTGSDTARNIIIRDTIDNHAGIERIDVDGWSYPYHMKIISPNILEFSFNNINLPQQEANPAGSMGYIHYTMSLPADLSMGTEIRNTAYIYFDYQPAIQTNTTICRLVEYNGINDPKMLQNMKDYTIYPNPANEELTIKFGQGISKHTIEITNMLGQPVKETYSMNNETLISTADLPDGVYFIRTGESRAVARFIVAH
jgi:hypothetical protein